jgi:hypothetical protein
VGQQFWPVPIVFHNLQIDSSYLDRVRISKSGTIFYLLRSVGQQLDYLRKTASIGCSKKLFSKAAADESTGGVASGLR